MTRPSAASYDGPPPATWARPDPLSFGPTVTDGPLVSPALASYQPAAPPAPPSYEPATGPIIGVPISATPVTAASGPVTAAPADAIPPPPAPAAYYPVSSYPVGGYPQSGYAPPGYPAPGYPAGYGYPPGYAAVTAPTSGLAEASLVIGVIGVFTCFTVVLPALAIIFGHIALRETRMGKSGRGMAVAGIALGHSALALFLLALVTNYLDSRF